MNEKFKIINNDNQILYFQVTDNINHTVELTRSDEYDNNYKHKYKYFGVINIPNSVIYNEINYRVTSIGDMAFSYCEELDSIIIPDNVTSIGDGVFRLCTVLESIIIPNSVTSIGFDAFGSCTNLKEINVMSDNKYYSSIDGVLYNKAKDTILFYPEGKQGEFTVQKNVTNIDYWAFHEHRGLTAINVMSDNKYYSSIDGVLYNKAQDELICFPAGKQGCFTIPNSIKNIVLYTLFGCSGITSIVCKSKIPPEIEESIDDYDFNENTYDEIFDGLLLDEIIVYVPASSLDDYENSKWRKWFLFIKPLEE